MYHDWGSRAGKWNGGTGGGMVLSRSSTRAAMLGLVESESEGEHRLVRLLAPRPPPLTAVPSARLHASPSTC